MAEGQSCENLELPYFYFKWKINIESTLFPSPSFTFVKVNFKMTYNYDNLRDLCEIYMEPEFYGLGTFERSYSFLVSVSVMSPDRECGGLGFTQKTLPSHPSKEREVQDKVRHVLWQMRKQDLLNIGDMFVKKCAMKNVTFFCVFGDIAIAQNDVFNEGILINQRSLLRLGDDLNKLRSTPYSTIVLKLDKKKDEVKAKFILDKKKEDEVKANKLILSIRSKKFEMLCNEMATKDEFEIKGMELKTLENLIAYIYTGRLNASKPSVILLTELYAAANVYKVDSLLVMTSFNLMKKINDPMFVCRCKSPLAWYGSTAVMIEEEEGHRVKKCNLELKCNSECRAVFAGELIDILKYAHCHDDKIFKGKIISSIVDYKFIFDTCVWRRFRVAENCTSLAFEVYDISFTKKA